MDKDEARMTTIAMLVAGAFLGWALRSSVRDDFGDHYY
jgi:hypothetical protein